MTLPMHESIRVRLKGVLLGSACLLAMAFLSSCGADQNVGERFLPKLFDTSLGQSGNPPQPVLTHTRDLPAGRTR